MSDGSKGGWRLISALPGMHAVTMPALPSVRKMKEEMPGLHGHLRNEGGQGGGQGRGQGGESGQAVEQKQKQKKQKKQKADPSHRQNHSHNHEHIATERDAELSPASPARPAMV